jgi:hypothetical protein
MPYKPTYTEQDRDAVTDAIIELAIGARVVRATVQGKTMEYAQTQMQGLKELAALIQADLNAAEGRAGFVLTSTSKGL